MGRHEGLPLDYANVVLITRVSKLLSEKYDQATLSDTTNLKSEWMNEFVEEELKND